MGHILSRAPDGALQPCATPNVPVGDRPRDPFPASGLSNGVIWPFCAMGSELGISSKGLGFSLARVRREPSQTRSFATDRQVEVSILPDYEGSLNLCRRRLSGSKGAKEVEDRLLVGLGERIKA